MTPLSVLGLTYVCLSLFFSLSLFFLSLSFLFVFSFRSDPIELDFKEISYLVKGLQLKTHFGLHLTLFVAPGLLVAPPKEKSL